MAKTSKKPRKAKALVPRVSFSRTQMILFVALFAVAGTVIILRSFAASPHNSSNSPFHLTNEYVHNSPNTSAPLDCLNEDDSHERDYSGYLNGSFSAIEQLCNYEYSGGIYWDSGGIGMIADAWITGTLADMTITSPTGVAHHAVLMGTSTSPKGPKTTTYHYTTCFAPPYSISSDAGGQSLNTTYPGDPWTYSISGNISSSTVHFTSEMTDVSVQQTYCPASEQNLVP